MSPYPTKIGIDFGGVIMKYDGSFLTDEYLTAQAHDNVFETIKFIVDKYGAKNCYIVSKAKQMMQIKIINWLKHHQFFQSTGFSSSNIHFVLEYIEKRDVIDKHAINVFIDDKIQIVTRVIDTKTIQKVIWFNDDDNAHKSITHIQRKYRNRLVIAKNWHKVHKILDKIPKTCAIAS
eukprot:256793_1